MEGDYCRYFSEFKSGKEKEQAMEGAQEAYRKGYQVASDLPPTHPIRLGLVLNFSVFYYEVKEDTETAMKLAKVAYEEATAVIDNLTEDTYKDSTVILQLLRENLQIWNYPDEPGYGEASEGDLQE